jgi:crotonobetainyl-CoA:carnitine CoA-transferase CaiB-like acyl-CoA transferase
VRHAGRTVGEDTRAVLAEVLGLSDSRIDALQASGAIHCRPAPKEVKR